MNIHITRGLGVAAAATALGLAIPVTAAAAAAPASAGRLARAPTAYVLSKGGQAGSNSPGIVTPISTVTNKPGKAIPAGKAPSYIAITPDGKTIYVSNSGQGSVAGDTVTPISTATSKPGKPIMVGKWPSEIAPWQIGRAHV